MKVACRTAVVAALITTSCLFVGCKVFPGKPTAAPRPSDRVYPVWFGTNRKLNSQGNGFTAEQSSTISHGRVDVYVPESHRFGETGNPFWKRLLRYDLKDDHLRVQNVERESRDEFYAEIQEAIKAAVAGTNQSQALVFLHGYNVTFQEAAIRAAQIGWDLKVPGPTAFFSWPSQGRPERYWADEKAIASSEAAITDFLVEFAASSGASNINVIAHSMGNRGLLAALQRISSNAQLRSRVKFNEIILAAPDLGRDTFLKFADLYPECSTRTTLYESNGDLPLYFSHWINHGPRAGYFKPYTVAPGVDTVAVPDFNIDLLGHSYFAKSEALVYDMRDLMLYDKAPASRIRMHAAQDDGLAFWKLDR